MHSQSRIRSNSFAIFIASSEVVLRFSEASTFQPTFLYELIFDFAWAAVLVWLGHHGLRGRKIKPPGLFALYVFGYSAYRIFEESLRIDSSVYFLGLRLNTYIASALAVGGLLWFWRIQRRPDPEPAPDPAPEAASAAAEPSEPPEASDSAKEPEPAPALEQVEAACAARLTHPQPPRPPPPLRPGSPKNPRNPRSPTTPKLPMADPVASDWRWWRERRPSAGPLHLDTAAAGRSSLATLAAAAAHAEREATTGAYVAQEEAEPLLAEGRANLARLLGVPDRGVAFVPSAQAALDTLLAIWPLREGDAVAVVPCEWGPNLDAFAARGLRVTEIAAHGDGSVDLAALERMLAGGTPGDPPAVVHLVQVTSHRGLVQPVAEAAALCRAAGVPLWVDAAQALGHVDTACGADAIYATSRKWLTGPRGVGVLGVAGPWWDRRSCPTEQTRVTGRSSQRAESASACRGS